jgi:hypothetical protein
MATRTITEDVAVIDDEGRYVVTSQTREQRIIIGEHCQACGTTDAEYVGWAALAESDGYTACCNEIAMIDCDPHCYHD